MAPSFHAYPSVGVVRREDFARTSRISTAFADVIDPGRPVATTVGAEVVDGGVRLRFASRFDGLTDRTTVSHKFFFVDREETRERMHLLDPANPEATTEVLVLMPEGRDRDYCHASVYDAENRLLAVNAVVFNDQGKVIEYRLTDKYVSPLPLDTARLGEIQDAVGRRALRFSLSFTNLREPQRIAILWEAIGLIHRRELVCGPDRPEVFDDLLLEDNPELAVGDWVCIAVDDQDRVIAQTLVTVVSADAGVRA